MKVYQLDKSAKIIRCIEIKSLVVDEFGELVSMKFRTTFQPDF